MKPSLILQHPQASLHLIKFYCFGQKALTQSFAIIFSFVRIVIMLFWNNLLRHALPMTCNFYMWCCCCHMCPPAHAHLPVDLGFQRKSSLFFNTLSLLFSTKTTLPSYKVFSLLHNTFSHNFSQYVVNSNFVSGN